MVVDSTLLPMRYIPVNQDGDFSIESLERAIEKDLAMIWKST